MWLIYIFFCSWLISCLVADEQRASFIVLNRMSELPACERGKVINLISYRYHESLCNSTEELANSNEFPTSQLYEMCSMQENCKLSKHFPHLRIEDTQPNAITVIYECIDKARLVDMCETITKQTKGILHLIIQERTLLSASSCTCFVMALNQTSFTMTLTDIRLKQTNKDDCSDSKIFIYTKEIACENYKNNNNDIFQQRFNTGQTYVRIMMWANSTAPRMVWMSFEAKGSSILRLVCRAKPRMKIEKGTQFSNMTINTTSIFTLTDGTGKEDTFNCPAKEDTFNFQALFWSIGSSLATALICYIFFSALRRTEFPNSLRNRAGKDHQQTSVKQTYSSDLRLNLDQTDTSFAVDEGAYNIDKTHIQINVANHHNVCKNEFEDSCYYHEIQDTSNVLSSSEIAYEKIDQDLRNNEHSNFENTYKSLVLPKQDPKKKPQVLFTKTGSNINLSTEQRKLYNADFLHQTEPTSTIHLQSGSDVYLHPCQMDANTKRNLLSEHQT